MRRTRDVARFFALSMAYASRLRDGRHDDECIEAVLFEVNTAKGSATDAAPAAEKPRLETRSCHAPRTLRRMTHAGLRACGNVSNDQ